MNFPTLSLASLPAELIELSSWETADASTVCISFWQYAKILLELEAAGKINAHTKKVLKELYFSNGPILSDELKDLVGDKDKIVTQGVHGLGGFGRDFLAALHAGEASTANPNGWPAVQFPVPYTIGNVFLQTFIDLVIDKKGGQIYFILRSRFRAALAQCYGDATIQNW